MTLKATSTAQYTAFARDGAALTPHSGFDTVATTTTFTITRPSGVAAGDVIIVGINYDFSAADPFLSSSGQNFNALEAGWNNVNTTSFNIRVYWKIATASEPSTYSFQVRNIFNNGLVSAYANMILGVWDGLTNISFLPITSGNARIQTFASINQVSPAHVVDIDSATITGSETTPAGALVVYFWNVWESIENFDGTNSWGSLNPDVWPPTVPYTTTAVQPTAAQAEQIYFAGLPVKNDGSDQTLAIQTLQGNRQMTMAWEAVPAGAVPAGSAAFTWQHAGDESGFGEIVIVYRLVLRATLVTSPYWGINATTVVPF